MKRFALIATIALIIGAIPEFSRAGPKTWRNYEFDHVKEAAEKSNLAVQPLLTKYPILHERLLQHRKTQWELAKNFGTSTGVSYRYAETLAKLRGELTPVLGEEGFNDTLAGALQLEIETVRASILEVRLEIAKILGGLGAMSFSSVPVVSPKWYSRQPPWSYGTYETKLNAKFALKSNLIASDGKPFGYNARYTTTLSKECQKRLEEFNSAPGLAIAYLVNDSFEIFTEQLGDPRALDAIVAEFNAKGSDLLLLRRSLLDMENLAKESRKSAAKTVIEASCRDEITQTLKSVTDRARKEDGEMLSRLNEMMRRTARLEEQASQYVIDVFSKAGEVYGETIKTERDYGLKAPSAKWRKQYETPGAIAKDKATRSKVKNYLVITPLFSGDKNLLRTWEQGIEGLEQFRFPYPGDKKKVDAHLTAKVPVDRFLEGKAEAERGVEEYLTEISVPLYEN